MASRLRVPLSDDEKNYPPSTICVTGGTGYIGGVIIQRLLASGHTVHATCRNPDNEASVGHLKQLPSARDHFKLFKADLLTEGSFDEAINGCDCVMHIASPFILSVPKGKERELLINPALRGTENVLASVNRTESVKRVVLTSSCTAVYGDPEERGRKHVFGPEDWNIAASEKVLPYCYGKRLAEEKAWEMSRKQSRWSLCTILPGGVFGPPLSKRRESESVAVVKGLMTGQFWPAAPVLGMGFVDVRDVAAAHCRAMVKNEASGRYIMAGQSLYLQEIVEKLRAHFPKAWLPKYKLPKTVALLVGPMIGLPRDVARTQINKIPRLDNSRAKEGLGIEFLEPAETLKDQVDAMVDLGILKPQAAA